MTRIGFGLIFAGCLLLGCGGTQPAPSDATDTDGEAAGDSAVGEPPKTASQGAESPGEEEEETPESGAIPTECAGDGDVCDLPEKFVRRLCQDVYPNVALVLFRGGSPWTRGYLTRKTEAWNAEGGASVAGWLEFDEEVIVLRERKSSTGGMQVSGAGGGYQALRWNGACVTLQSGEVSLREPPNPKAAKVEWKWLDDHVQESLRTNDTITETYRARRSECKGAMMGRVSKKCETLDAKLSRVIVDHVRGGGPVGEPQNIP